MEEEKLNSIPSGGAGSPTVLQLAQGPVESESEHRPHVFREGRGGAEPTLLLYNRKLERYAATERWKDRERWSCRLPARPAAAPARRGARQGPRRRMLGRPPGPGPGPAAGLGLAASAALRRRPPPAAPRGKEGSLPRGVRADRDVHREASADGTR